MAVRSQAAAAVNIPARMEIFRYKDKTVILDGAHNAQKLHAFLSSVEEMFQGEKIAVLVSFAANRDYRLKDSLRELSKVTDDLIVTAFENNQDVQHKSVEPDIIANIAKAKGVNNVKIIRNPKTALEALLKRPEHLLLVTGSFYLLNHIRPLMLELKND